MNSVVDITEDMAYNTAVSIPDIVIDTNVVMAAIRSKKGASYRLLSLLGTGRFEAHDSVALVLEYEEVIQRHRTEVGLSQDDASALVDSLCATAHHHKIHFLWRPFLPDANHELLLELAVSARCEYIVTHNISDFRGSEEFGVKTATPKGFLQIMSEVKE